MMKDGSEVPDVDIPKVLALEDTMKEGSMIVGLEGDTATSSPSYDVSHSRDTNNAFPVDVGQVDCVSSLFQFGVADNQVRRKVRMKKRSGGGKVGTGSSIGTVCVLGSPLLCSEQEVLVKRKSCDADVIMEDYGEDPKRSCVGNGVASYQCASFSVMGVGFDQTRKTNENIKLELSRD
ncbi:unnamed protein product [Amaranthus hypochondriacus]